MRVMSHTGNRRTNIPAISPNTAYNAKPEEVVWPAGDQDHRLGSLMWVIRGELVAIVLDLGRCTAMRKRVPLSGRSSHQRARGSTRWRWRAGGRSRFRDTFGDQQDSLRCTVDIGEARDEAKYFWAPTGAYGRSPVTHCDQLATQRPTCGDLTRARLFLRRILAQDRATPAFGVQRTGWTWRSRSDAISMASRTTACLP